MTVKLTVAVMAHPDRPGQGRAILDEVCRHPTVEARGVFGEGVVGVGAYAVAKLAWLAADPLLPHLVLPDDVFFCSRFGEFAAWLLSSDPRLVHPVSFYLATRAAEDAEAQGKRWIAVRSFLNTQALSLPPGMPRSFVDWADDPANADKYQKWGRHDDTRFQDYFRFHKIRVLQTAPSLVQHDLEQRSVLGHPKSIGGIRREARRFLGVDGDPFALDWSVGLDSPTKG